MDAPCLDCGEPMMVETRDEAVIAFEPATLYGYAYRGFGGPPEGRAFR